MNTITDIADAQIFDNRENSIKERVNSQLYILSSNVDDFFQEPKNSILYIAPIPYSASIKRLSLLTSATLANYIRLNVEFFGITTNIGDKTYENICTIGEFNLMKQDEYSSIFNIYEFRFDFDLITLPIWRIIQTRGNTEALKLYLRGDNGRDENECMIGFELMYAPKLGITPLTINIEYTLDINMPLNLGAK